MWIVTSNLIVDMFVKRSATNMIILEPIVNKNAIKFWNVGISVRLSVKK